MSERKKAGGRGFYLTLIIAAFVITAVCTLTSLYSQGGYNLQVGGVSDRRYKAPRKIENTIATDRNRADATKAATDMKPIYKKDPTVDESVLKNITDLFTKIDAIRLVYQDELTQQAEAEKAADNLAQQAEAEKAAAALTPTVRPQPAITVPTQPAVTAPPSPNGQSFHSSTPKLTVIPVASTVVLSGGVTDSNAPLMPLPAMEQLDQLQLTLSDSQSRLLLNMDNEHYESLKNAVNQALKNVLAQGVQDVDVKSLLSIQDELSKIDITADMRNIAYQIASAYLQPNYVIDAATTAAARQEIASQFTVVYVLKDQTIVDEGQIISIEAYTLLESLGMISDGLQNNMLPMIASFILEAILFILFYIYIRIFYPKEFANKKETALLFTIYAATVGAIRLLAGVPYQFLPILLFTMLIAMLIDLRLSIVLNFLISIIAMLIYEGGIEFLVFYTTAGLAVSILSKYTTERNQVFIVGIAVCALSFVLMFLILLIYQRSYSQEILIEAGYAAGNGIFSVIVCLGSLPFWETFFGVITKIRLLDMTNPNSALLRRLIIEAPGTYHHSLVVANLAETAAYEIGADANLARVGGYYHDIGKLKNPQFFTENQDLVSENPHNGLTPLESAGIIIGHVSYGKELAKEFKLPPAIADFIVQHHGTTLIQYFFCKAKEKTGNIAESDFRYPYIIPQNKETAILMLADTAEAAVRSMKKGLKDFDSLEADIKRLIKAKLDDGQLLDSGLSIKDLDLISKAFMRVFRGMFHERIEYPKMDAPEVTPAKGEVSTA